MTMMESSAIPTEAKTAASARPKAVSDGRADAAGSGGGGADNIPPVSSHGRCSRVSEDTAVVSAFVHWKDEAGLISRLAALKERANELRRSREKRSATTRGEKGIEKATTTGENLFRVQEEEEEAAALILNGGEPWEVLPYHWGGRGRSNMVYDYALVLGGVGLGVRTEWHDAIPNVKVEIGSIPLAQFDGLAKAWDYVVGTIADMGGEIDKHVLSRVDMYTDLAAVPVMDFCKRYEDGRRICRARRAASFGDMFPEESSVHRYGRRYSGFSLGSHIKLRVYDKVLELALNPVKQEVFNLRYGGLPEELTRIEYQLRREATHEFMAVGEEPIDTVEQYERNKAAIWRYLTKEWFRMVADTFDHRNKNHQRAKTWPVWDEVVKAADGRADGLKVARVDRVGPVQLRAHVRQAASLLIKAAIFCGEDVSDLETFIGSVFKLADRHLEPQEFAELCQRYKRERRARVTDRHLGGNL